MTKKSLRVREIEKLENTSIAAALFGGVEADAGPILCRPSQICVDSIGIGPLTFVKDCVDAPCVVQTWSGAVQ